MATNTQTGSGLQSKPCSSKAKRDYHDKMVVEIICALSATRKCIVWEQPTGMAFRDGAPIRYGFKGSADVSGITLDGKRLEVECKTGKARQQQNQKDFQAMIERWGGIYIIAKDGKDAVEKFNARIA